MCVGGGGGGVWDFRERVEGLWDVSEFSGCILGRVIRRGVFGRKRVEGLEC